MTVRVQTPSRQILGRILKFGIVGVVNNAVGYGLFVVLSLLGVGYVEAMTASYLVGMVISFWGNRSWTFGHGGPLWPSVARFLIANAIGYSVNFVVLRALVASAGIPQIPAQLVATAAVAICTFGLMRLWVFRARPLSPAAQRGGARRFAIVPLPAVRLLAAAFAATAAFIGFQTALPLPAMTLAAAAAGVLAAFPDRVAQDYVAFGRRASTALAYRSRLSWTLRIATFAFCSTILLLMVPALVKPVTPSFVPYDQGPVLILGAVILALLPLMFRFAAWTGAYFHRVHRVVWVLFLLVVGVVFALTQITVGAAVRVHPAWDAGLILNTATDLSRGGHLDAAEVYFGWYPNNLMLTWMLWMYFAAIGAFGVTDTLLAAIVLHALFMSASIIFVASVARRIAGYSTAVFFLIPSFLFVALGGWNGIPYSDTFGMIFPAGILWLVAVAEGRALGARIALWTAAAAVAAVGMQVKPTVVFAVAAACVVSVLWKGAVRKPAVGMKNLAVAAVSVGVLLGASTAVQNALMGAGVVRSDLRADTRQVPLTHFLKMGASGLGVFEQQDVWETNAISDPQERFENGIDVYLQRVREMGPIGYVQQIITKMSWSVSDGSFYAWGEGLTRFDTNFPATDDQSSVIRKYFTALGEDSLVIRTVWQAGWLVVLLLVAAPLAMRHRTLFSRPATMMRVSLLMLVAFLALFENRARYLYLYVPYFLLLASLTVSSGAAMARSQIRIRSNSAG